MQDLIGRTLGHYRITDKLGEGGMGEVYRAHDERLDRDVAVKVLPEAVAQDADRLARFEREAKAVARLSHPNILEIFDFGREGDVTYAVTELLDGETLRARLEGGPLGWPEAIEIGAAIADGLAAAHQAGIVHRDLKPTNVFMTFDGRVKVLDFGLARTLEIDTAGESHSPTVSRHTDPGSVLGTVGYMSPEQVRGEPVGYRSDIFSLGCVLYELVCGRRAFSRDTAAETMTAILKEEPSDLRSLAAELPPALTNLIRRCLEKRPEARFQNAQDLAFALRSVIQENSGPIAHSNSEEKSIVVLPFDNLSPDPDQEYFSDGLTEEIISDLVKVRPLRVISRTSAMQLKGTEKDLRTIGRELNVRYVLEGSVRRAGNALRITAQLIDAATDTHLWAEKYTGSIDDVFDIQEKVSRSIVDALEVELSPQENRRISGRPMENIQAYELSLRAKADMFSFTEPGIRRAVRDLEGGLKVFGDDAELYYLLGDAYLYCLEFGVVVDGGALPKAEECAKSVMRLDAGSWHGHYLLGRIERFRGHALDGLRHFERAFSIEPDSPDILAFLTIGYAWQAGQPELAVRTAKKLIEVDPLATISHFMQALARWLNGDLDRAIDSFGKVSEMEPDNSLSRMWNVFILLWKKDFGQAFEFIDEITRQRQPDKISSWTSELLLFTKYAFENKPEKAFKALSDSSKDFLWNDPDVAWVVAGVCSVMNEHDEALRWFQHAIDCGWINYPLFAEQDPFYVNIRRDERFQKLLDTIKPQWERFEIGIDVSALPPVNDD